MPFKEPCKAIWGPSKEYHSATNYAFLDFSLRMKDFIVFELKNGVYTKNTPIDDPRTTRIEDLDHYPEMLLVVISVSFFWVFVSKNYTSSAESRILICLGRSGRLKEISLP